MEAKKIFIITGLILSALFAGVSVYSQDEIIRSDEIIRMDTSAFTNPQRAGAVFDHDLHNESAALEDDCSVCHHVYEDGKRVEDESSEDTPCGECHELKATPKNSVPLRKAYHNRCKDCHFSEKKGPVLCGECHIK